MIVNAVVKAFSKIFVLPKIVEQIEPLGDVDGEGWFGRPFKMRKMRTCIKFYFTSFGVLGQ